jgi:hypothetical protein
MRELRLSTWLQIFTRCDDLEADNGVVKFFESRKRAIDKGDYYFKNVSFFSEKTLTGFERRVSQDL